MKPVAYNIYLGIPGYILASVLMAFFVGLFLFIMYRRFLLLRSGSSDPRFDHIVVRFWKMLVYAFAQWKQPRYLVAGVIHILIFIGFITLSLRSINVVGLGFHPRFNILFFSDKVETVYGIIKDYIEIAVLFTCVIAIIRRAVFRPARYYEQGKGHGLEAYLILGLISALMITDMLFEGADFVYYNKGNYLFHPASTFASFLLRDFTQTSLSSVHTINYWLHFVIFFFFLCYLPLSKHFHVITSIPNVFLMKLRKGVIKPIRHGVEDWTQVEKIGVSSFEDFTWKHILDFYTCTDCGRCTDNCPANATGRPLSPRMITIKARDYGYEKRPVFKKAKADDGKAFIGNIIKPEEVWSCTTCGACEEECPVMIEYIDKIVDIRRSLVENGEAPKSFDKPLRDLNKKGNPYGTPQEKRVAWTEAVEGGVNVLKPGDKADVLFFVDSCASFDPRIQKITQAAARIMKKAGVNFGVLGESEYDSGNEVRRVGEEGLFQELLEKNISALEGVKFNEIVTTDPHAFNVIKNEYSRPFKISHFSQFLTRLIKEAKIKVNKLEDNRVYTYHDPCYLGRHNGIYREPREIIHAIPGLSYKEMKRSFSRSFCCGGGGLYLWFEAPEQKMRMGEKRIAMADEAGAQGIVTSCPYCMVQLEDATKTSKMEEKIEIIDMAELFQKVMA